MKGLIATMEQLFVIIIIIIIPDIYAGSLQVRCSVSVTMENKKIGSDAMSDRSPVPFRR